MKKHKAILLTFLTFVGGQSYSLAQSIESWLTTGDQSAQLARQSARSFGSVIPRGGQVIEINPLQKYQSIDGFGFALTGGSAQLMMHMAPQQRHKLIHELFATDNNSIGISYLRVSIGSSDLNDHTFSYDDLPNGQVDRKLEKFTLKEDEREVIPVLKEILAINPYIKILASPWSAPLWMKTNTNIQGGMLKDEYYPIYARYFVKYIKSMQQHGITIDAVTVQNEPFNDGNTPSMQFLAKQELRFVRNYLGPAFKAGGLKTKIILYDHNCDAPEYPISILTDPEARKYVDGSGFHLYVGQTSAMSKVHAAFPRKNLYFTEMMVVSRTDFNVAKPEERIVIGAIRNWSRNVILWNIAADPNNRPHTDNGGCPSCQGAVTLDGNQVTHNLAYYTIGHASKFVPMGSYRIESSLQERLANVAFQTPSGKIVLIVANKGDTAQHFAIQCRGKAMETTLPAASVATYLW